MNPEGKGAHAALDELLEAALRLVTSKLPDPGLLKQAEGIDPETSLTVPWPVNEHPVDGANVSDT